MVATIVVIVAGCGLLVVGLVVTHHPMKIMLPSSDQSPAACSCPGRLHAAASGWHTCCLAGKDCRLHLVLVCFGKPLEVLSDTLIA